MKNMQVSATLFLKKTQGTFIRPGGFIRIDVVYPCSKTKNDGTVLLYTVYLENSKSLDRLI